MFSRSFVVLLCALALVSCLPSRTQAAPGDVKWTFNLGGKSSYSAGPTIGDDGTVYVGSIGSVFFAITPDGKQKWSRNLGDEIAGSAALADDGTLFIGSKNFTMFALDSVDGSIKWTKQLGNTILASAAIGADGTVYIGCGDLNVYALYPNNGTTKWRHTAGDSVFSSPAIGEDGTVYIGSNDNNLYAFPPDSAASKWTLDLSNNIRSSPTLEKSGNILIGTEDGAPDENSLWAVSSSGSKRWQKATGDKVLGSAVIGADDTIYFISKDDYLYALDQDGLTKWTYYVGGVGTRTTPVVGANGYVYAAARKGYLYALSSSGSLVWSKRLEAGIQVGSPVLAPDGTLYVGMGGGNLYAVETESGGLADSPWPTFRQNLKSTGRSTRGILPDTVQASGVTVTMTRSLPATRTAAQLQSVHKALADFTPTTKTYAFNATITPNLGNATFYFLTDDLNGTVAEFWLYKLKDSGGPLPFAAYSPKNENRTDGVWWLTDNGGTTLQNSTAILTSGTTYRVYYSIQDNGPYDLNATKGAIRSSLVLGRFPVTLAPSQQNGVLPCVCSGTGKNADMTELYIYYGVESFLPTGRLKAFNASVTPANATAVFRFNSTRLEGLTGNMTLLKFFEGNLTTLAFPTYANASVTPEEGFWWIAYRNGTELRKSERLTAGTNYFISFAVRDNGAYDSNPADGRITDPLALGAFEEPSSGSGGCMLNPSAGFGPELLLLLLGPLLALLRRR